MQSMSDAEQLLNGEMAKDPSSATRIAPNMKAMDKKY
jgi:hypothetical protein